MVKLENITIGARVKGIEGNNIAEVVAVKWHGSAVISLTYREDGGSTKECLLYRTDEERLQLENKTLPWSFNADGNQVRLASEAYRINLAHIFDPYLAVHTSTVEPLPHQITAVYGEMLKRIPLRYVLADDPGAGKTIMTGLYIKELITRGELKRCLIVCPGSLAEQWQDELRDKFHIRFEIMTNDRLESAASGNAFSETNLCIARLDKLARNEDVQAKLFATDWDLIVVDEAHKMSATYFGNEVKYTKRYNLGRKLSDISRNFLLLTATPHNGKEEDFQLFMSLVDPDRYEGVKRTGNHTVDVSDVMRRLVKEELLKFDGTRLFPERLAYTVNYELSALEQALYEDVTEYVRKEFNRAENLGNEQKTNVGFALTVLQRRLASSPEAIYQSLKRRRERLEVQLSEAKHNKTALKFHVKLDVEINDEEDDEEYTADEREKQEDEAVAIASAAHTIEELEAEIETLGKLENQAQQVLDSGKDKKWDEMSKLLQENVNMFDKTGVREKIIIFTEHRDTLNYLQRKITSLLGNSECVQTIHGGLLRDARHKVEQLFKQDPNVLVLLATDAAGEGINLQRAHLMANYDLPWNPNRLEQRFGRIHRIGQTEVCHLWNLVAKDTREGIVFQRLLQKLEEERAALGGKVFDILGKVKYDNKSLKDLLIEAIRYGNEPEVKNRLKEVIGNALDRDKIRELLKDNALTNDVMDISTVTNIKATLERIEAHRLQPYFIEAFFLDAFKQLGGIIQPREEGRYEIMSVPFDIVHRDSDIGKTVPVLKRYERVCFEKEYVNPPDTTPADLLCPGHPLLDAVIYLVLEHNMAALKQGTIFVNDNDSGVEPKLLFYVKDSIQNGVKLSNEQNQIISQQVHFLEMRKDGNVANAGYAPYLDYRPCTTVELEKVMEYVQQQDWLKDDVEELAMNYAVEKIVPEHLQAVKDRQLKRIKKTEEEVRKRLLALISYWDNQAYELEIKERAGKKNAKLNSLNAERRAEEFRVRLAQRMKKLEAEKAIKAVLPQIIGGSLVIPQGLLNSLMGGQQPDLFADGDKKAVELAAMNAVMQIEKDKGYLPKDVSKDNVGYDIESFVQNTAEHSGKSCLRFIEVKGRQKGATTVTVTRNEILTGYNKPNDFILAIVEVDGTNTKTVYLKHPFDHKPGFATTSENLEIDKLLKCAEIIYQE